MHVGTTLIKYKIEELRFARIFPNLVVFCATLGSIVLPRNYPFSKSLLRTS